MIFSSSARDFWYEAQTSALTYYIEVDGYPIYSGKAVSASGNARINIGRRVSDYLETDMPDFREYDGVTVFHPNQMRVFNLMDDNGNVLETYTVLLDADGGWTGDLGVFSDPVNTHADPRQKLFITSFDNYFFYVIPDTYLVPFDSSGETVVLQVFTNLSGVTFSASTSGGTVGYNMEYTPISFTFTTAPNTGETPMFQEVYFYNADGDLIFVVHLYQDYGVNDHFGADDYNVGILECNEFAYVTYDGKTSSALTSGNPAYFCIKPYGDKKQIWISRQDGTILVGNSTLREEDGVFYGRSLSDYGCTAGFDGSKTYRSGNIHHIVPYSAGTNVEYIWTGMVNALFKTAGGDGKDSRGYYVGLPNLKEIVFRGDWNGGAVTYENGLLIANGGGYPADGFSSCPNLERVILPAYTYAPEIIGSFNNCPSLRYVRLPESTYYIEGFDGCSSLHTIIGPGLLNVPYFGFPRPAGLKKLYVGGITVETFKSARSEQYWHNNEYNGIRENLARLGGTYLPYIELSNGIVKLKYDADGRCSIDE